jgi:hypothetical protein
MFFSIPYHEKKGGLMSKLAEKKAAKEEAEQHREHKKVFDEEIAERKGAYDRNSEHPVSTEKEKT